MPRPRPLLSDLAGVRAAYDAGAEELAARFPDTGVEAPLELALVDAFAAAVAAGDDARVLDAGCGGGRMSRYVAARGCRLAGVDLSPGMISTARRDHSDLSFTVGSLTDLPHPDRGFAGVLLWYSVIHTPPGGLAGVAAEVTRVLRPGGQVLVGFQAGEGTRDVPWAHERGFPLVRHLHTPDGVASVFEAAGLREECRVVRRARGGERDDQAFLWLQDADCTAGRG